METEVSLRAEIARLLHVVEADRERIEELEAKASAPGRTAGNDDANGSYSREQNEYKGVFLEWVRKSGDAKARTRLEEAAHDLHKRDVTIGTPSAGGYALPEQIEREVEQKEIGDNPIERLANVVQTSTNDYKELMSLRGETAGWVGETGTRTATATPTLREIVPTMGELYAYPTASEWSLDDLFHNTQNWLTSSLASQFGWQKAQAYVSGNGTSRPTGFLNSTPTSLLDDGSPQPGAATLQYLPGLAGSPGALNGDLLIDFVAAFKEQYLSGDKVAWLMNVQTLARIRKLKSSGGGDYLWQPSLAAGQPSTLLGFPVYTSAAMPAWSSNLFPVAFGNWQRGYTIAKRTGTRITVDNVTQVGFVKFFVRTRVGGIVRNREALKVLKVATS